MKTMSKRKVISIALSGILVAGVVAGLTLAYLNRQSQTAANAFAGSEAKVNVGVLENNSLLENESGGNSLNYSQMTSAGVDKSVKIKNINKTDYPTTDTYVRVRLVPIIRYTSEEKNNQVAPVEVDKVEFTYGKEFSQKWDRLDEANEIYYYYKTALAPDESTSELITKVAYTGTIPEGAAFEVQVLTEGIAKQQYDAAEKKPWSYGFDN